MSSTGARSKWSLWLLTRTSVYCQAFSKRKKTNKVHHFNDSVIKIRKKTSKTQLRRLFMTALRDFFKWRPGTKCRGDCRCFTELARSTCVPHTTSVRRARIEVNGIKRAACALLTEADFLSDFLQAFHLGLERRQEMIDGALARRFGARDRPVVDGRVADEAVVDDVDRGGRS